jgi:DNA-binding IclR family transcriptional regulator
LISTLRAVEIMAFGPTSAPVLAELLSCHPRIARRILGRPVDDGWARRIPPDASQKGRSPRYDLTLRVIAMAAQATQRSEFREALRREQVGEVLDVNLPEQPHARTLSIELVPELTLDVTFEYENDG